jgi:hypothetical protein
MNKSFFLFFLFLSKINFAEASNDINNNVQINYFIEKIANKYTRPFSVLNLNPQKIKLQITHKHAFVNVLIENTEIKNGNHLQEKYDINNTILLRKKLSTYDLHILNQCEYFDITIAIDFIEHFKNWRETLKNTTKIGDDLIFDIPSKRLDIIKHILTLKNISVLTTYYKDNIDSDEYILFWIHNPKNRLSRDNAIFFQNKKFKVYSDYNEKYLLKSDKYKVPWQPGINLITYKYFNGIYPPIETIEKLIINSNWHEQRDPLFWNIILQGNKITWIDNDPHLPYLFHPTKALRFCLEGLDLLRDDFIDYCKNRKKYLNMEVHY